MVAPIMMGGPRLSRAAQKSWVWAKSLKSLREFGSEPYANLRVSHIRDSSIIAQLMETLDKRMTHSYALWYDRKKLTEIGR